MKKIKSFFKPKYVHLYKRSALKPIKVWKTYFPFLTKLIHYNMYKNLHKAAFKPFWITMS